MIGLLYRIRYFCRKWRPLKFDEAQKLVRPYVFYHNQYQAVRYKDVVRLLGQKRFSRLLKDKIRGKGPIENTVYPWNVITYLQHPNLNSGT